MLKLMKGMPDDVLGVSAEGKITGKDYEKVLIPAVNMPFYKNLFSYMKTKDAFFYPVMAITIK